MRRRAVVLLALCAAFASTGAQAQVRKYVVYFQEWSAAVDDSAQAVIREVADLAKRDSRRLDVVGFTDRTGSKAPICCCPTCARSASPTC
jgi:outer membrane protein OmpA-like peptidoglycan-associated protein